MNIVLTILSALAAYTCAEHDLKGWKNLHIEKKFTAESDIAQRLLEQAVKERKLEDYEFDEAFVATHSIVYESCYNDTMWGDEGYQKVTLVRFTLCPSDACADGTCSSEYYGEYVVDLQTFLDSYLESKLEAVRAKCENMREVCGCEGDNNACLYYCYKDFGEDFDWTFCREEQGEEERYAECQQLEINNDDGNNRALSARRAEYNLYVGPVCSADGVSINLNIFADEECQYEHSNGAQIYNLLTDGEELPYSKTSLVKKECVSCLEPNYEQQDDDYEDEDEVSRFCEESYDASVKCETYLESYYKNENGCGLIEALKNGQSGASSYYYQMVYSEGASFYAALVGGVSGVIAVGVFTYKKKKKSTAAQPETEPSSYELS